MRVRKLSAGGLNASDHCNLALRWHMNTVIGLCKARSSQNDSVTVKVTAVYSTGGIVKRGLCVTVYIR